jgi:hypothetical protein
MMIQQRLPKHWSIIIVVALAGALLLMPHPTTAQHHANVYPDVGYPETRFAFYASGFEDNEAVGTWLNTPAGESIEAEVNQLYHANGEGRADWYWVAPFGVPTGTWEMVARGLDSGYEVVIPFEITVGEARGVNVQPEVGSPGTRFAFFALDFEDSEEVAVWVNDPTGQAQEADVEELHRANDDGRVDWYWDAPDDAMPGIWQMVIYGIESETERTVTFEIR